MENVNTENANMTTKNGNAPALNIPHLTPITTLQTVKVDGTFRTLVEVGAQKAEKAVARAKALLADASLYDIDCQDVADLAGEVLGMVRTFVKTTNDERMAITRQLDDDKKAIMNFYRPAIDDAERADRLLCERLAGWRAKLDAEQRRQEAESRRLIAEQTARIAAEAAAAAAAGDAETVLAKTVEAHFIATPVCVAASTKIAGITYVDNWKVRIVDASQLPREYLMPDEQKLAAVADAMKDQTRIPGVEVYNEKYPKTSKRK